MDLDVGALDAFGRVLHDLKVSAQRDGDDWQLTMRRSRSSTAIATWRGRLARRCPTAA